MVTTAAPPDRARLLLAQRAPPLLRVGGIPTLAAVGTLLFADCNARIIVKSSTAIGQLEVEFHIELVPAQRTTAGSRAGE